ncbi:MAG: DUF4912 domain-containing protein [Clostridia bacterium]|nr:DUF4912 domain-containing protein [Clostridia bacterium]
MPRKEKDTEEKLNKEKSKKTETKKTSKSIVKKEINAVSKADVKKKAPTKKVSVKKVPLKKTTSKTTESKATKKVSTKKPANKKTPVKKTAVKVKNDANKINVLEYYDLPYRYNQTVVRILAQTPKTLFVYWDISDKDRQKYIKQYGESFFENTKPVLIIHNNTMNYTFEIVINDFANCWYFNINDEKCDYSVELGRRPKESHSLKEEIPYNYLYITSSNEIETPNGHILFEKEQKTIFYRNVKTNETYSKDIANLEFMRRIGRIYKIYDIYHKLYKEDEFLKSEGNPSSRFF